MEMDCRVCRKRFRNVFHKKRHIYDDMCMRCVGDAETKPGGVCGYRRWVRPQLIQLRPDMTRKAGMMEFRRCGLCGRDQGANTSTRRALVNMMQYGNPFGMHRFCEDCMYLIGELSDLLIIPE